VSWCTSARFGVSRCFWMSRAGCRVAANPVLEILDREWKKRSGSPGLAWRIRGKYRAVCWNCPFNAKLARSSSRSPGTWSEVCFRGWARSGKKITRVLAGLPSLGVLDSRPWKTSAASSSSRLMPNVRVRSEEAIARPRVPRNSVIVLRARGIASTFHRESYTSDCKVVKCFSFFIHVSKQICWNVIFRETCRNVE